MSRMQVSPREILTPGNPRHPNAHERGHMRLLVHAFCSLMLKVTISAYSRSSFFLPSYSPR